MHFQDIILTLQRFWSDRGCVVQQPYDMPKGAGTFNPATFLRAIGPEPWRVCHVEPSRRPADGRYGENPNRLQCYYQFQVILKPSPDDVLDVYLESLSALGVKKDVHDLRFVEDDWESPTLGAWGLGWEVWLNGMEITQFTYFQQVGGIDLKPVTAEITYGLERIAMYLQEKESVYDLEWNDQGVTYGHVHLMNEREQSAYNFETADPELLLAQFNQYEKEALRCAEAGLVMPAYDHTMLCSHAFNMLQARGVISITERAQYILRVRKLASATAGLYAAQRESLGHPLLGTFNAPGGC